MVFEFLKKKGKKQELELPPPPKAIETTAPEEIPEIKFPEIPAIDIEETSKEDIPRASDFLEDIPKIEILDKKERFAPTREQVLAPRIKPTFIAVDEYTLLMENTNLIRSKLLEAESYVEKMNEIKSVEKKNFEKWRSKLEDIEKKLSYVDKVIAKAQEVK